MGKHLLFWFGSKRSICVLLGLKVECLCNSSGVNYKLTVVVWLIYFSATVVSWYRRINCCHSWCQGISSHDIDIELCWLYRGNILIRLWNIWILKCIDSLYSDFMLYIFCCRVLFLTGNKTPFATQVRVHHLLINPARMGSGLTLWIFFSER